MTDEHEVLFKNTLIDSKLVQSESREKQTIYIFNYAITFFEVFMNLFKKKLIIC